jgi:hypothetical protein
LNGENQGTYGSAGVCADGKVVAAVVTSSSLASSLLPSYAAAAQLEFS